MLPAVNITPSVRIHYRYTISENTFKSQHVIHIYPVLPTPTFISKVRSSQYSSYLLQSTFLLGGSMSVLWFFFFLAFIFSSALAENTTSPLITANDIGNRTMIRVKGFGCPEGEKMGRCGAALCCRKATF